MSIQMKNFTHKELDITISVALMGYEGSDTSTGTATISMGGQVVHSQPLNIQGDTSDETLKEVLSHTLKEYRETDKHKELFTYFKSIAVEFYPIFDGNDPFQVLEMHKPGFESIEEVRSWAAREFPTGTEYFIINEFGLVCAFEKIPAS